MNKNILGTISISKKASKLLAGADVVFTGLEDNKARLVLVSNDCSPKTLKPIAQLAKTRGVAVMTIPCTKEELGSACAKSVCAVVAITDTGLATSIGKKLADTSKENEEISKVLNLKLKRKIEREERKSDPSKVREKKPKTSYQWSKEIKKEKEFAEKKAIKENANNSENSQEYTETPPANGVKWNKFNKK